jgi:hypothetical protein
MKRTIGLFDDASGISGELVAYSGSIHVAVTGRDGDAVYANESLHFRSIEDMRTFRDALSRRIAASEARQSLAEAAE